MEVELCLELALALGFVQERVAVAHSNLYHDPRTLKSRPKLKDQTWLMSETGRMSLTLARRPLNRTTALGAQEWSNPDMLQIPTMLTARS